MSWYPKDKVVVPVDFSEFSIEAIGVGLQIAKQPHGVHVVHVLPHLPATEPGVVWGTVNDETRREHATQALHEILTDDKYKGVQIHIEFGDPGHCIAELAERIAADLVVIPSHGRTGIARLLIGSTAERVVRLSHCPVLVQRSG